MNRHVRLGAFAATALALGIFATACGDDDDDAFLSDADTSSSGALESAATGTAEAPRAQAYSSTPGTDGAGGGTDDYMADPFARKIIFNAVISLETDDVRAAFAAAGRVAVLRGGFVEGSSLSGAPSEDDRESAHVTLRVPADSHQDALQDLRLIEGVEVTSENASTTEVTEEYTDLQSRLRNLERTEAQYLELMAKATTIDDILTVSDRLESVRLQIEQVQGRINYLDNLTGLATIDVAILETLPVSVAESGGTSIGEAFADAWELSLEVAQSFAVAAAYLAVAAAWIAVPAAIVLLAVRRFRRHAHTAATNGGGQASA